MSAITAFSNDSRSQSAIVAYPVRSELSAPAETVAYATMPRIVRRRQRRGFAVDRPGSHASGVTSFPEQDVALTHILIVSDVARSRAWYIDVLGATLYREYGGTSVVLSFAGAWLLLTTGGPPTDDKPSVTLAAPADPTTRDNLFTIRVADCQGTYDVLRARGASFHTPPVSHGAETRAFFSDPDGHLFEISEYRPG